METLSKLFELVKWNLHGVYRPSTYAGLVYIRAPSYMMDEFTLDAMKLSPALPTLVWCEIYKKTSIMGFDAWHLALKTNNQTYTSQICCFTFQLVPLVNEGLWPRFRNPFEQEHGSFGLHNSPSPMVGVMRLHPSHITFTKLSKQGFEATGLLLLLNFNYGTRHYSFP